MYLFLWLSKLNHLNFCILFSLKYMCLHIHWYFFVHIFQEKDAEHKYSHVIINSASSSSSGSKFSGHEVSLPASLSPFIRSLQKMSPKTEAHPNALKNINKDYTLLQASIKGIINPNEGYKLSQRSRSLSTLDFRNLDQERISKLYRFNKHSRMMLFFFSTSWVILSLCYLSLFIMIFNFLELSHE